MPNRCGGVLCVLLDSRKAGVMSQEVWCYEKLSKLNQQMWDAMAREVEAGNLYVLNKFFLDKTLYSPIIHDQFGRFIMAPVLGAYNPNGIVCDTDYDDSLPTVMRGLMRSGDPLGGPYRYETRISSPPKLRQVIEMPRDTFKSTTLEGLIVMLLLRDPNCAIMVAGRDSDRANAMLGAVEQHIDANPKLIHYWRTDQWHELAKRRGLTWTIERKYSGARSVNRQDPSMYASSLGSCKPGNHFDYVILDDLIDNAVVASDELSGKVDEMFDLIAPMLGPRSIMWVVGTRWARLDLYESLELQKNSKGEFVYDCYIRDSVLPNGRLWWPERKSEDVLLTAWDAANRTGQPWQYWSQQRMQPISEAEQSLMLDKIVWETKPCNYKNMKVMVGIDPADEDGRDNSGSWAIWAMAADHNRHFHDLDLTKARIKGDRAMGEAIRMVREYNAGVVIIENTVISRRFITAFEERLISEGLRNTAVVKVEHHGQSKSKRVMNVENAIGMMMAQERLHLRDGNNIIKNELRTFPAGNYTYDELDIGAYMTAWASANSYFPRKPEVAATSINPVLARHRAQMEAALAERDRKASGDLCVAWESSGVMEYR